MPLLCQAARLWCIQVRQVFKQVAAAGLLTWERMGRTRMPIQLPAPPDFFKTRALNATCTGLLRLVSNEDELAAVLAHECAHVVAR